MFGFTLFRLIVTVSIVSVSIAGVPIDRIPADVVSDRIVTPLPYPLRQVYARFGGFGLMRPYWLPELVSQTFVDPSGRVEIFEHPAPWQLIRGVFYREGDQSIPFDLTVLDFFWNHDAARYPSIGLSNVRSGTIVGSASVAGESITFSAILVHAIHTEEYISLFPIAELRDNAARSLERLSDLRIGVFGNLPLPGPRCGKREVTPEIQACLNNADRDFEQNCEDAQSDFRSCVIANELASLAEFAACTIGFQPSWISWFPCGIVAAETLAALNLFACQQPYESNLERYRNYHEQDIAACCQG